MDQPWTAPYIQKLDVEPDTAHHANLNMLFRFAEEDDVPYLRDQLQQVTRLLYSNPRMSCMPTLWHQRAQILSLLRFPDLALGDAYKAYLLLTSVGPVGCSKSQDEIPGNTSQLPTFIPSDPDEENQPFQISQGGTSREVRICPQRLKVTVKATICKILLLAGCLQDCISLLMADPWPEDMQEDILLLSKCATEAKLDELRYHHSNGLNDDEIEEALIFGSVYALPLPWVDPDLSQRSLDVQESIATELQILSGFTCVLKDLPSGVARSDNHDCNGIFANVDFPSGHTILSQDTVLVATNAGDPRCASCRRSIPKIQDQRSEQCCNLICCSPECQARANHLFHDPANCRLTTNTIDETPFPLVTSSALQPESDSNRVTRLLLNRLLQLLVKEYHDHDIPPLEHRDVQTLHARLSASKSVTFSFANDIQRPMHYLQSLDIDVFANEDFDTWIILDIIRRMKINQWDQEEHRPLERPRTKLKQGQQVLWSGLTPGISLLNHSCRPNVTWKKDDKTSKMTITTSREVAKGEELTISYLPPERLTDDVHERQEFLADWFSRCRCDWCSEQFALLEAQSKSADKDETNAAELLEGIATQYKPSLVEQWFGSTLPVIQHKSPVNMKTDIDTKPDQPAKHADRAATPPKCTEVEPASSPDVPLSIGRLCSSLTKQDCAVSANGLKDTTDTDESSLFVRADNSQPKGISVAPDCNGVEGRYMDKEDPAASRLHSTTSDLPRGAPAKTSMSSQVSQAISLDPSATPGSPPASPAQPVPAHRGHNRNNLKRARSGSPSHEDQCSEQVHPRSIPKLKLNFGRGSHMPRPVDNPNKTDVPTSISDTKLEPSQLERSQNRSEPLIIDLTHSDSSQSRRTSVVGHVNPYASAQDIIDKWHFPRRPQRMNTWWSITKPQWHEISPKRRNKYSHLGRLMESDAGVVLPKAERCDRCRTEDVDCIVYSEQVKAALREDKNYPVPRTCVQCIRFNCRCHFPHFNSIGIDQVDDDRRKTIAGPRSRDKMDPGPYLKPQASARRPRLNESLEDRYRRASPLDRPLEDRYRNSNTSVARPMETSLDRPRHEWRSDSYTFAKRQKVALDYGSYRDDDDRYMRSF